MPLHHFTVSHIWDVLHFLSFRAVESRNARSFIQYVQWNISVIFISLKVKKQFCNYRSVNYKTLLSLDIFSKQHLWIENLGVQSFERSQTSIIFMSAGKIFATSLSAWQRFSYCKGEPQTTTCLSTRNRHHTNVVQFETTGRAWYIRCALRKYIRYIEYIRTSFTPFLIGTPFSLCTFIVWFWEKVIFHVLLCCLVWTIRTDMMQIQLALHINMLDHRYDIFCPQLACKVELIFLIYTTSCIYLLHYHIPNNLVWTQFDSYSYQY